MSDTTGALGEHFGAAEGLLGNIDTFDATVPGQQPLIGLSVTEAQVHATLEVARQLASIAYELMAQRKGYVG